MIAISCVALSLSLGISSFAYADSPSITALITPPTVSTNHATSAPVVASSIVPDDATKQALLGRLRELYGDRVVDQVKVGNVRTPPQWSQILMSSIQPNLKEVTQGRLDISGANITLHGNVTSDVTRSQLEKQLGQGLPTVHTPSIISLTLLRLNRRLWIRHWRIESLSSNRAVRC